MSPSHPLDNRPPAAVNVEIRDELWLIWDPTRGHWTLRHPDVKVDPTTRDDVRVMPRGSSVTVLWPETR